MLAHRTLTQSLCVVRQIHQVASTPKVVLVEASRKAKQKLSSFIQLSALRDIARSRNFNIEDLIPKADLDVLMSQRA